MVQRVREYALRKSALAKKANLHLNRPNRPWHSGKIRYTTTITHHFLLLELTQWLRRKRTFTPKSAKRETSSSQSNLWRKTAQSDAWTVEQVLRNIWHREQNREHQRRDLSLSMMLSRKDTDPFTSKASSPWPSAERHTVQRTLRECDGGPARFFAPFKPSRSFLHMLGIV